MIMKKAVISILTILLISLNLGYIQAEEVENTESVVVETEDTETLSETLEEEKTEENIEEQSLTFGTILFATLTPALFIVIGVMLMRFFK